MWRKEAIIIHFYGKLWAFPDQKFKICAMSLFCSPLVKETLNYTQFYAVTPLWTLLGFSDTLGHVLPHAQNKLRESTGAHRHRVQSYRSLMLTVFPGKERGRAIPPASIKNFCETITECYLLFTFFLKSENPLQMFLS